MALLCHASLINYINPGPIYTSAEDDAVWTMRLTCMLLGVYDQNMKDHLVDLKRQTSDYKLSPLQRERRQLQAQMASAVLSALPSQPLPADKQKEVTDLVYKNGSYLPHVRSVLVSIHTNPLKKDEKLAEEMSKFTSANFAYRYCKNEYELVRVLFVAEQACLKLLTNADVLKAAGVNPKDKGLGWLAEKLIIQSKNVMQKMLEGEEAVFLRTEHHGATPMSSVAYVTNHGIQDYVKEPAVDVGNRLKNKLISSCFPAPFTP